LSTEHLFVEGGDNRLEYADLFEGAVIKLLFDKIEFAVLVKGTSPEKNNFKKYSISEKNISNLLWNIENIIKKIHNYYFLNTNQQD